MGWVGWVIMLALPLWALAQLVLLHRIGDHLEADDPRPVDGYGFVADAPAAPPTPGTCGRCGTANDPAYRYCRACVARLAG